MGTFGLAKKTYTQAQWAVLVLSDAHLPATTNNVGNLMRWMVAEEPASNWFHGNNPLNVGATTSNSNAGFSSLSTGARATAAAIRQSNMRGIYNALAATATINAFSAAVVASPWAAGHYGGTPNAIARIHIPSAYSAPHPFGQTTAGGVNATVLPGVNPTTRTPQHTPTTCLIKFPGVAGVGSFCVLSKSQGRALKGGLLVAAGGSVMLLGILMLGAFGLNSAKSKALLGAIKTRTKAPIPTPTAEHRERMTTTPSYRGTFQEQTRQARERERHGYDRAHGSPRGTEEPFGPQDRQEGLSEGTAARARRRDREMRPRARR